MRRLQCQNRLISVAVGGQTTTFIYDGDGNLVKKINPNGSKTLYVGGIYEVDKASGGSVTRTVTYYPVAGAMRIDSTHYYILKDHLGSASVVTNNSGTILGTQRYYSLVKRASRRAQFIPISYSQGNVTWWGWGFITMVRDSIHLN